MDNVGEIIRKMESDFQKGETRLSKYVNHSIGDTIEKIYAYLNSVHTSGKFDAFNQEKPFFNIVVAAANIWFRATDIDRSQIKIRATKQSDWLDALIFTAKLQEWMREARFGTFLNDWGRVLSRYGSCVVKFVRNSSGLHIEVKPWSSIICDSVDFESNPHIEILELTDAQLKQRVETHGYDKEQVDLLLATAQTRETKDRQKKDNRAAYHKLYEIHGVLSKKCLTGEEKDKDIFVQQMHVVSFVGVNKGRRTDYQDFTLIKGEEEKDPFMLTHLIKEDDRALSIGAVEYLFNTQWMQNHSMLAMKQQLELASKLIFQTADSSFVGRNALAEIENGDILIHKENMPISQVNNQSHDMVSWSNFAVSWKSLGNELVGISEAMLGVAPKAGTAWRQTEALLAESHSLFELMTENKGLCIEDMMNEWILPYIQEKTLDNVDEVIMTLESHDINRIDARYVKNRAIDEGNEMFVNDVLTGKVSQVDYGAIAQNIKQGLTELGNQRSFVPTSDLKTTWKKHFSNFKYRLEVDITGEQKNVQEAMTTLNSALKMILTPGYDQNPKAQMVVGKILELSGAMSPLEIASMPVEVAPQVDGAGLQDDKVQ